VPQSEVGSVVRPLPKLGVGVLAERDGKIAMGLRRYKGGNVWSLPGGKVDPFESVLRCGQRELAEETGLVADELKVFTVYEFIEQEENYHFITFGVISHSISGELTNLEPRIFAEWDWFDLSSIPSPLFPPSYHLLAAYRTALNKAFDIPTADPAMLAHRYLVGTIAKE
jgi:8-oxo-dGTP diphosphatase